MIMKATLPADIPDARVRRFSVDEYHQMIATGILKDGDPFELLEGWIVPKMTRGPAHDLALEFTVEQISALLPAGWRLRVQSAISTLESEPEPDIAAVRGHGRKRLGRHPRPAEIGMLVEVADASLTDDRTVKLRIFARAKVPIYWIVNLKESQVEVYTDPTGPAKKPRYRKTQVYGIDEKVPLVIDGKLLGTITVRDMLP